MPQQLHSFLSSRKRPTSNNGHTDDRNLNLRDQNQEILGNLGESCCYLDLLGPSSRPPLNSSARTVPTDRPSPVMSSLHGFQSDGNLPTSRKVQVSDAELIHRACQASLASRKGRLLRVPSVMWDCKDISGFAMLSRRVGEDFEVLTTGEVACEPCDIEPLLRPRTESEYNVVSREFHGDQFIYGSIVHEVQPRGFGNDLEDESDEKTREEFTLDAEDHAAVRTACFAHSRSFARNEEWCFLEHFRPRTVIPISPFTTNGSTNSSTSSVNIDDPTGFTIVMSSMPESELAAGKMKKERVIQLHGITATYLVEPVPQTARCRGPRSRVSFHAKFTAPKSVPEGWADSETVRSRLVSLAKSLHRLPDLVLQRKQQASRFSMHGSFSSRSGQEHRDNEEANNSRCVACTKRLRMKLLNAPTRRSKRCEICMYRACASCWSKENVETFSGPTTSVVICRRCHENFGSSNYSHIQLT
ncbi:unnamed protein product [Peronospora belbahrii]|uniref:FYVE-type domain-containing protein n=1 Tax=Peronospora belbahrii TaxID=622444 RepID=A0AAU9L4G7_9STRA|nr:unnamed protein product [Peronospora belbahrii]CAH0514600.1 unnamed protein product [Peronospora belbahrii]